MSNNEFLYIVHCIDDLSCGMVDKGIRYGGSEKRMGAYGEHKEYQALTSDSSSPNYIKKVAAGPMESDDGKYMIGSFFIVESTREGAEKFIAEDPFSKHEVWEKVSIHRYLSVAGIRKVDAVCGIEGDLTTKKMVVVDNT